MLNRRHTLSGLLALAGLPLAGCASREGAPTGASAPAGASCGVMNAQTQKDLSPDEALRRLKEGHERFVAGRGVNCDLMAQVKETGKGQYPFAAIVGCIDSRVPPELVFDQRIGDIFTARVAGNFVNTDILGSLEFATAAAGARLICVLGHSECGAIKGAIDDVKLGNLTSLLANIRPSLSRVRYTGVPSSKDKALVQALAEQNAKDAAAAIMSRSPVIAKLVGEGKVKIVTAMHDVTTGRIAWLG